MAVNDPMHPEHARAAQDVETLPMRPNSNEFHGGRGGAGNIVMPSDAESEEEREEQEKQKLAAQQQLLSQNEEKVDYRGWADRGKDLLMLKLGRGKKQSSN
ncbi:hypothetical protein EDC01DRAFT_654230 [Geopyxis carbonaria]|nr:hypothetical protein EDC01DRAFT_654230 [Geopyxis carbonaria]